MEEEMGTTRETLLAYLDSLIEMVSKCKTVSEVLDAMKNLREKMQ